VLAREPRGNEIETALNLASKHQTKFHVASITVFEPAISLAKAKIKPRPTATPAEIKQALQAVQGFLPNMMSNRSALTVILFRRLLRFQRNLEKLLDIKPN
jgi:hypothetical protein